VITKQLKDFGLNVVTHGYSKAADYSVDASVAREMTQLLDKVSPTKIVNLIALTNVDQCEINPLLSRRINIGPCESIKEYVLSSQKKVGVVHLSTDHMYGGDGPHVEKIARPVNQYGADKLEAESQIQECNGAVIRTNFFGLGQNSESPTFSDWIYEALSTGKSIGVHSNVQFTPLSLLSLVEEITFVLSESLSGVFNIGSSTGLTKYRFATKFAEALGMPDDCIQKKPYIGEQIARPLDMRMDSTHYQMVSSRLLPTLEAEIEKEGQRYVEHFKSNNRN